MRLWNWVFGGLCAAWLWTLVLIGDPQAMSHTPQWAKALWRILGTEATAAWVQAIFSVAAIWFAGRAVLLQHRSAALKDMESLSGLVRTAKKEVDKAAKVMLSKGPNRAAELRSLPEGRLVEIAATLSAFPFAQLGSTKSPHLIVELTEAMRELEELRAKSASHGLDYPVMAEEDLAPRARRLAKKARKKIKRWAADRRRHRDRWWYK